MKLIFFDTETTGLDFEKCSIHQMSGVIVIDGEIVESFDLKFRPFEGCLIEEGALKTCNLTENDLMSRNMSYKEAYTKFVEILSKYINKFDKRDKFFMLGYNVNFDKTFLVNMFEHNGNKYLFSYIYPPIDVMSLAMQRMISLIPSMNNQKQGTVAKVLGIDVDDTKLHDSLYDVYIMMRIYTNIQNNVKINLDYDKICERL